MTATSAPVSLALMHNVLGHVAMPSMVPATEER
jgi:hypothetical protein